MAAHVLSRLWSPRSTASGLARRARATVFLESAKGAAPPGEVLATVGRRLGLSADELAQALFSDLPGERVIAPPAQAHSPCELALRVNLALAQGLLFRATSVRIEVVGNARALVRQAKLRGLLCAIAARPGGASALEVSGPLALFRRTLLYGRALANLVPMLATCPRFQLRAECVVHGRPRTLQLASGDPIFPAPVASRTSFDSQIEERFASDLGRIALDWDMVREPQAVASGSSLLFPDFLLQHRLDPSRRWLLEIVGFWTPDYLARKLAAYRAARIPNLILCVDEQLSCAQGDLPAEARIVRFRRRVRASDVLAVLENGAAGAAPNARVLVDEQRLRKRSVIGGNRELGGR
jgi:predicted nuclease of restriction endonuclease-like RecB superfamily